ncbi:HesB/IscA family protein [Piscinibacter sp.]|jgi:iron-sulfur cluster assembly protein|uniref:HesB/IscA family protein n=1 Tax=Piscinibacter sp. TaxID=1903157 RepID=UPI00355A5E0E
MLPNITITPAAEKFMRRFVRFSGQPAGAGFRLTVSAGGCSGYNSEFTVEAAPLPGDAALDVNGLTLLLPAESRLLLDGVTIDCVDTTTKSGLSFFNPAAAACACSSSEGASSTPPGLAKISISSIRPAAPKPLLS